MIHKQDVWLVSGGFLHFEIQQMFIRWHSAVRLQHCILIFGKIIEGGLLYGITKHDYSWGGWKVGMPKRPAFPKKKKDCQGFQAAKESLTLLLQQTQMGVKSWTIFCLPFRKASYIKKHKHGYPFSLVLTKTQGLDHNSPFRRLVQLFHSWCTKIPTGKCVPIQILLIFDNTNGYPAQLDNLRTNM
jgi:hypothetical protein